MELVKYTPEELAAIERDKTLPHVVMVLFCPLLSSYLFQESVTKVIEQGMVQVKARADAARMLILSTSVSTNTIELTGGLPYLLVMLLCQWAEIEKLEEQQRRQFLAAGGGPRRGA